MDFVVDNYNINKRSNIYCIKKKNSDSKNIEIDILNGNDDYKSFSSKIIIGLHETDNNFEFLFRDYNHDGKHVLYCIDKIFFFLNF